jgi:hypothetical protein
VSSSAAQQSGVERSACGGVNGTTDGNGATDGNGTTDGNGATDGNGTTDGHARIALQRRDPAE